MEAMVQDCFDSLRLMVDKNYSTHVLDNINVGQRNGSNLDETDKGLWGGLIVLGNAPISADATEALIEGLPRSDRYTLGKS